MLGFIDASCALAALLIIIVGISELTGNTSISKKLIHTVIRLLGIGMVMGLAILCNYLFK